MENSKLPVMACHRLYLANMSFETHEDMLSQTMKTLNVQVDIDVKTRHLEGMLPMSAFFDVQLSITLFAKGDDGENRFVAEVAQGGVFEFKNMDRKKADDLLNVDCPRVLEPYVNQYISDMVIRSGHPAPTPYLGIRDYQAIYNEKREAN
jgi:preprotein translocase subunit SecB